jgi:PAS domain S-box-containing protein
MTPDDRGNESARASLPSAPPGSAGGIAHREPRDRLVWSIAGAASLFGIGYGALYLVWGAGPVLAELPWFNAVSYVCHLLAAATVAVLAVGRYRVLREPVPYWISLGFAGYSLLVIFYLLAWPGLLPAGVLTSHSNSAAWLVMLAWSLLAGCLLAAADCRRSEDGNGPGPRDRGWLASLLGAVALTGLLVVVSDHALPALVTPTGNWTASAWGWQVCLTLAYAIGVARSTHRARVSGDPLPGYVALSQLVLAFGIGGMLLGGKRYDVWWYLARLLGVGGFLAMMGGLLAEYMTLFQREHEKTRKVQAQAAALQQAEAALRRANEELEARVQERTAALQASEERFAYALQAAQEGVWDWNLETNAVYYSPRWAQMLGYAAAEIAPHVSAWERLLHPDDVARVRQALDAALRGEREYEIEFRLRHTDGHYVDILARGLPVRRDADGPIVRVVGTHFDLTERKRAEAALQSAARFPDENPYPVLRITQDGTLLYANRTSESLLRTWECRVGQSLPVEWCARVAVACERGKAEEVEITCVEGRVYACALTPIAGTGYLNLYARDITQRKQAEQALQQAHDELERRVVERTAALSGALQKVAFQSEQLRSLASELTLAEQRERSRLAEQIHDGLQQLLVAAQLRVSLIGRGADPVVRQGCQDVVRLLADALADARSLTTELSPPVLRTGGLLAGLDWLVRWSQETHHFTVSVTTPATPLPPIPEDLTVLLFQSVRELLFNAVKYAQIAQAEVALAWQAGGLTLTVADAGVGFAPRSLRGEGGAGGGFGLARIRHRLELLGGCLHIESAPGHGSRVTLAVRLPTADPPSTALPQPQPSSAAQTERAPEPDSPRKIRVLVVDDHQIVRQALVRLLRAEADLAVVGEAGTGTAAVALAHQVAPDVVLMDINMPEMNGIEATRAVHAAFPALRVIGLSMYDRGDQQDAMRAAGAVAYLSKSGPAEALLAAIRDGR